MRSTFSLLLLAASIAWAQPAPGRGGAPPAVKSPEVSADRKVTFRLRAPNAREVAITGMPGGRLALQKDEQGVWSVTTGPLEPEVYTYAFNVDGATFSDPGNPLLKPNFKAGGQSMVRVPGAVSWDAASGGPRGVVSHHFYKSAVVGDDRDFYVYTPPSYDPNRKEPYPVLYLLHGLGDDAAGWLATGSANIILDNLIAQGKAKPMIMVNTLGYGAPEMVAGGGRGGMNGPGIMEKNSEYYARALIEEVIPQVEKHYRASKDRKDRAIAGLSMGGAEALFTGLNHIDRFGWVASFSGAFVMWNSDRSIQMGPAVFTKTFPALDAKAVAQLRLFWISCGESDGLVGVNRQFKEWLASKNIQPKYLEHPGAHTWSVWRHNLTDLAPLLFQKN